MAIQDLQRDRLQTALSMRTQDLVAIANGSQPKYGVDSLTAVMALQIKGPAEKAARAQQAAQQAKQPSVKDQVISQAAPEDVGIGALPAGDVMTERGMASGGIVAFQGGGDTSSALGRAVSGMFGPSTETAAYQAGERGYDARINQIQTRLNQLAGTFGLRQQTKEEQQEYTQLKAELNRLLEQKSRMGSDIRRAMTYQPPAAPPAAPTAAPTAGADQGQQPPTGAGTGAAGVSPSGFGGSSLAGFPAVGPSLKAAEAALKARGEFDPFASLPTFDTAPYESVLPMTPEQIREEMGKGRTQLDAMFPEKTREEVEQRLAQRYAGLEEMFKQREARAGEARKEAEAEKGRTAGIGLMQLASELVTKPLTKIDTAAAFQTFKDANTDFRKAQKEYREGLDKIAEARELQKIGQGEKADDLFRQGALARFNFENEVTKAGILQDAVRKSGVRDIFDKKTNAQLAKYDAAVKSAELGLSTALKGAELGSEERRAGMYAAYRGAGQAMTKEDALRLAQTEVDKKEWADKFFLENRRQPSAADKLSAKEQIANDLLQLYNRLGTTAPSGGGAGPVIDFRTGKPLS